MGMSRGLPDKSVRQILYKGAAPLLRAVSRPSWFNSRHHLVLHIGLPPACLQPLQHPDHPTNLELAELIPRVALFDPVHEGVIVQH